MGHTSRARFWKGHVSVTSLEVSVAYHLEDAVVLGHEES